MGAALRWIKLPFRIARSDPQGPALVPALGRGVETLFSPSDICRRGREAVPGQVAMQGDGPATYPLLPVRPDIAILQLVGWVAHRPIQGDRHKTLALQDSGDRVYAVGVEATGVE